MKFDRFALFFAGVYLIVALTVAMNVRRKCGRPSSDILSFCGSELVLLTLPASLPLAFLAEGIGIKVALSDATLPETMPIYYLSIVLCTVGVYLLVANFMQKGREESERMVWQGKGRERDRRK